MISAGLLVLLGLVVWVVSYGPPELSRDTPPDPHADAAFAELAALFDKPVTPPDRSTHPR